MDKRRLLLEIAQGKHPKAYKASGIDIGLWVAFEQGEASPEHGTWLDASAAAVSGYKEATGKSDFSSTFANELRLYGRKRVY